MNATQLSAAAAAVVQLDDYLQQLKAQALAIYNPDAVTQRGYITPRQELKVRQLQLSYWKTRSALLELIAEIRTDAQRLDRATPQQFLVGLAAAALLVDAARWLRRAFHRVAVVRRKLDEPDPIYNIPPRMYDGVQRSLVSVHNAWNLWQATRYYDKHRDQLVQAAASHGLQPLVAIIDRLRDQLRPSLWMFLRTRFRVRGRRTLRRVGRDVLGRAVYAIQQAVSERMAEIKLKPGHQSGVPPEIRDQVTALLRPGDVLVVRKEFAATNYFLPGYWPHAALVLGTTDDLERLGVTAHEHVTPRLAQLASTRLSGAAASTEQFVLESMKDGVRIRPIDSPLASDSIVVLRSTLEPTHIGAALAQAFLHEGKPYDFDFDFSCSHRMVCTEVIYRAYDGVENVEFTLERHVGRYALAAGDLLRMALAERHFTVVAVYSPAHGQVLEVGPRAIEIVRSKEGAAT